MKTCLLAIALLICSTQMIYSQEEGGVVSLALPIRNSLKFNRFIVNPTFSFVREQNKYVSFTNKREWVQFEDAPQTFLASYSGRSGENMGLGIGVFQQNYGVLTTFGGIVNFAYNAHLDTDSNLTFGLNVGAYKSGLNTGNVITNFDDPALANVPSNFLLTVNPGINYGTAFIDFGVSINNLALYNFKASELIEDNPEQSIQGHIMYTGYTAGGGFFDESRFSGLIRSEFKKDKTVVSGVAMLMVPKGIWAQIGFNNLYGASAGLGLNITKQIAVEYNFEKALGDLTDFGPSHEITLAYKFNNYDKYDYSREDDVSALFSGDNKKKPVSKTSKVDADAKRQLAAETKIKTKEAADQEALKAKEASDAKAKIKAENKAIADAKVKEDAEAVKLASEIKAKEVVQAKEKIDSDAKAQTDAEAAKLAAELQAKEVAQAKAKIAADNKVKAESKAKADAEAEKLAKESQAKVVAEAKAREEAIITAKEEAERKAKLTEELRQKIELDKKEALEAQTKLEAERIAKLAADAKAKQLADETAKADAEEQLRIETAAKFAADAQAKQLADETAKADAEEQLRNETAAKLALEEKDRVEAENKVKAETDAAEKLRADTAAREKLEAEIQAKLQAETEAKKVADTKQPSNLNPSDALGSSMLSIEKMTEDSNEAQKELLTRFTQAVANKDKDLKDLKEENDLSDKGIYTEPKPFKSVTEENNALDALKIDLDNAITTRNERIKELEALYEQRVKIATMENDTVNLYYQKTIKRLKAEQLSAIQNRATLSASLETIKEATEVERKRRIKRAAFDNEQDKYNQDRAALSIMKQNSKLTSVPLKEQDFDFGEEQSKNIQILKNVKNIDNGYYLILAVHNDVAKRDDFLRKVMASGRTDVDFFYDVNTSNYYIYYDKFDSIENANDALKSKGNRPYNTKLSIVKIEN